MRAKSLVFWNQGYRFRAHDRRMPSPKPGPLLLTDGERKALEALVRERTAS